jgi:hypothetical protein
MSLTLQEKGGTTMTLITERIESVAQKIYLESLKKPGIPEDICSDIYLEFIIRMKRYRDIHPQVKKFNEGFITRCVTWIICYLLKKKKKEDMREQILINVCEDLLPECGIDSKDFYGKRTLKGLYEYIKLKTGKKNKNKTYALMFILYYSYYLPDEFSAKVSPLIGVPKSKLCYDVRTLKKRIAGRISGKMQKQMNTASACYFRMLMCRKQHSENSADNKQSQHLEKLERLKVLQEKAIDRLRKTNPVPRYTEIADICGVHVDTVRYGLKTFTQWIREFL